jgi:asparagine synthase (glutamine-hydrolysing)
MSVNQTIKIDKIEKRILREAFEGYLPTDVLWRQKDGMSDAVGTNWVDEIKKYAESEVDDKLFRETRAKTRTYNTPLTKERGYVQKHLLDDVRKRQ